MMLTIDVRKAHDTGIGTYIRHVVPRVLDAWPVGQAQLLAQAGDPRRHDYLGAAPVPLIDLASEPFSAAEQWVLRRFTSDTRLLWATSLAHPLFTRGRIVNTVHDLAQLALPAELGGTPGRRLLARPYFESIRRCADHVIHVSDFTATEFHRLVGAPLGRETVAPLGVDRASFGPMELAVPAPIAGPYFLMIGNLRPHKNLPLVLDALERLGDAVPHRLLLVGPDQGPQTLTTLRRLHGPRVDRLTLGGNLDAVGLRGALLHAEALLFPSHYEGFGLPVLEAMASGCPVLVARNGVSAQLAGDLALNFDPGDAAALARAMAAQVAMEGGQRQRQAAAGLECAAAASWDHTAELTLAALRMAGGHRRSTRMGVFST